ncbi:MAG: PKD-like domain-containing protein [Thiohalospira sp.]
MIKTNKHIAIGRLKAASFLPGILIALACMVMFIQPNRVQAQVMNVEGVYFSVTNGTHVQGDTLENTSGNITNEGTINLNGHYKNMGSTAGNGFYNLKGDWLNTGTFTAGTSSVNFFGDTAQKVLTGGDQFYNLIINNSGASLATNRIILLSNVNVSNSLAIQQGNVETDTNILYLVNPDPDSLKYTSTTGSRVIGKFERGVDRIANYLFPVGSEENYNPLNLNLNEAPNAGSVLSEFVAAIPDSAGLPLPDAGYLDPADSVEVYRVDSAGYWSLTARNDFTIDDFDINMDGTGFSTPYQNATRVIKRPEGGSWIVDGKHRDADGAVIQRDNLTGGIESTGTDFGWGHIRPRIQTQPADTAICDGESAAFSVVATGRRPLSYEWQVLPTSGGGWQTITDDETYDNSDTDTLLIISADTSMNGYKYRVIITDSLDNFKRSNSQATLTVNPRPEVLAIPQMDTICDGETTYVEFTTTVPGSSYEVEVIYDGVITGATDESLALGATLEQQLFNPTLNYDSVVYRIVPYGPFSTNCEGTADTVVIWVEPTVEINAVDDTICNGSATNIMVTSPNTTTNGIRYTWTVTDNPDVTGESNSTGQGNDISTAIVQNLTNNSQSKQLVQYTITPWTVNASGNNECTDAGEVITIDIWVEPTVEITASNDTLCDGGMTNIEVNSLNTTTNGIRYTWTVEDNPNIEGESNSTGQGHDISIPITQTLTNTSDSKQLVQYTLTPWTVNASDNNECTDPAEEITVDIWVNPTPRVIVEVVRDTICNDTYTEIVLTTPSVLTTGEVTFDYISTADAGLTGNSADTDRTHGFVIADSLHNNTAYSATPLVVRYEITPRALDIGCANGPTIIDSVVVHPTPDIDFAMDSVRCYLESNGKATVFAQNGVNIFTYLWNDPMNQTSDTASGLSEGTYAVTVTDNQACTVVDSVYVAQPNRLIPDIDTVIDASCYGFPDGYASLDPYGGNGGYTYQWSSGQTTSFADNLWAGEYFITVQDYKDCSQDTSLIVIQPGEISASISPEHVTCNGDNDGKATLTIDGSYDFIWSTGETSLVITDLAPGSYSVTVGDIESCYVIKSVEITEPDSLLITSVVPKDLSCAGDADGSIDITVEGGNDDDDYIYTWATPDGAGLIDGQEDQSGLSGGSYYVTVNDRKGCETTDSAVISEPPAFLSDITTSDITCNGDADGEITVTAQGGNGDFSYLWSTGDTLSHLNNLDAGTYFVTVIDSLECEIYDTAQVVEPGVLESDITKTDITCFGDDNGTAIVTPYGGNGNYSYNWNNGETTDSIYGLPAGNYEVTVTDYKNCLTTNAVEILQPEELIVSEIFENITCFGYDNGKIVLTPQGGTTPYQYAWNPNTDVNDSIADNLEPGAYEIIVTDANNCEENVLIELTQPDPLIADIDKSDITCYGFSDGYIGIAMFGGTPDYTYNWSNGYDASEANMLDKGEYQITVTDQNDCALDTVIEIIEPEELVINPQIRRPTCPDIQNGYIELNISGGVGYYNVYWDNGSAEENLYDIRSGIYDVVINDENLCEIDTTFILRSVSDNCLSIPSAFTPNGDGFNDRWEIEMSHLYPAAEIEIFDRWGKRIFYSKGYDESQYWDGTFNGNELPMDTYYYIINLKNGAERISGTVTIIR